MYEFFIGLGIGFIETVKVGMEIAGAVGGFVVDLIKGSADIYKELDE